MLVSLIVFTFPAQILKKSIDPQQNPCDDFYQFSCGNWPKNHPNEISTVTNSTLQIRFDNNMEELIGKLDFIVLYLNYYGY